MPKKPIPKAPDWDVQWGKKFPANWNEFQRHMYCARRGEGTLPQWEHYKWLARKIAPHLSWHYWADIRFKGLCEYKFTTWMGGGGCVHPDTVIPNPVTGEQLTIKELHDNGIAPWVMTLYGPIKAEIPFIKGFEPLFEVELENGSRFTTTAKHRVLTPRGYIHVCDLRIGDTLPSWVHAGEQRIASCEFPHPSTEVTFPSTRASNVLNSQKKVEGFQGHYSFCSCPYDEQPPEDEDTFQSSFPSQVDALGRNRTSFGMDDPENKFDDNPRELTPLPSTSDSCFQDSTSSAMRNQHFSSEKQLHAYLKRVQFCKSYERTLPLSTSEESRLDAEDTENLCDNYVRLLLDQSFGFEVGESRVRSITARQAGMYYDITVPGANHYFSEGAIHHNTAKTNDAALFALTYFCVAPHETAVVVCSTTKEMLRARIWGQIARLFQRIPPNVRAEIFPQGTGDLLDSQCFIRFQEGDSINVIKGVAIQDGPVDEAVNNIIGQHTTRVFWLLDEMQGVRSAIMDAIPNLLKNPEPKFHGMGNPQSLTSMLCRYSEPKEGWKSIPKFTSEWEIDSQGYPGLGRAFFFDGRKSPAVLDPEWGKKNPWMLNQQQIDDHLRSARVNGDESHPDFMWQTIGWPPDKGLEQTVLDQSIVSTFLCTEKPIWTSGFTQFASLDPAYNGGDDAILQIMRRGLVKEEGNPERWVIAGVEQINVPISSESEVPIDYQIVNFVKAELQRRNIPSHELAVASAGRGGGLKSIFEMEWGSVNGIEEGGSPSERVVNERGKTARESYNTRASELCFAIRDFALGNGLRAVPFEVIDQACKRLTFYLNGKWCVEPKTATKGLQEARGANSKGFKQRIGRSPDHLDAWSVGLEHARQKGAEPSFGQTSPKKYDEWNAQAVKEAEVEKYEDTNWREEFLEMDFLP